MLVQPLRFPKIKKEFSCGHLNPLIVKQSHNLVIGQAQPVGKVPNSELSTIRRLFYENIRSDYV